MTSQTEKKKKEIILALRNGVGKGHSNMIVARNDMNPTELEFHYVAHDNEIDADLEQIAKQHATPLAIFSYKKSLIPQIHALDLDAEPGHTRPWNCELEKVIEMETEKPFERPSDMAVAV